MQGISCADRKAARSLQSGIFINNIGNSHVVVLVVVVVFIVALVLVVVIDSSGESSS